jgi:hypothetical protein
VVRTYLDLWEDPAGGDAILAIVRSAIASDRAADRLCAIVSAELLRDMVPHLRHTDGEVRTTLAGAHLMGVAIARYVLRVEPIASLDREHLIALCAPTIHRYLAEPLPG